MTNVLTTKGSKVYHTDSECPYLNDSNVRDFDLETAKAWDMTECQRCSGEKIDKHPDQRCVQCGKGQKPDNLVRTPVGDMCDSCRGFTGVIGVDW